MIERLSLIKIDVKQKETGALLNWVWNSHWWIEYAPGYCTCKWCGQAHTSEMAIGEDFPLCQANPAIISLLSLVAKLKE